MPVPEGIIERRPCYSNEMMVAHLNIGLRVITKTVVEVKKATKSTPEKRREYPKYKHDKKLLAKYERSIEYYSKLIENER